jgi:hypothetical protein
VLPRQKGGLAGCSRPLALAKANAKAKKRKEKADAAALPAVQSDLLAQMAAFERVQAENRVVLATAAADIAFCTANSLVNTARHMATTAQLAVNRVAELAEHEKAVLELQRNARSRYSSSRDLLQAQAAARRRDEIATGDSSCSRSG